MHTAARTLINVLSLKLRKNREYSDYRPAEGCCGVEALLYGYEGNIVWEKNIFNQVKGVLLRTAKTVKLIDADVGDYFIFRIKDKPLYRGPLKRCARKPVIDVKLI